MPSTKEIANKIEFFQYKDGNWLDLDKLVIELWNSPHPEDGINSIFKLFQKYPIDDGSGVFWSILHGLETLDYEQKLCSALLKKPFYIGIIMLIRIEKSGAKTIAGKSINELKNNIRTNPNTPIELLDDFEL